MSELKENKKEEEACFQRCPHDAEHPYSMISNEMIRDRSISPKAKGVLLYLLHLPKGWKIYHTQLLYALNIGKDYLKSAIDELMKEGYIKRTRKEGGVYQPYIYFISELKKFLPERVFRSGKSEAENPPLLNTNITNDLSRKEDINKSSSSSSSSLKVSEKTKSDPDDDDLKKTSPSEEKKHQSESITYRTPKGESKTITDTEIFRHFVKFAFPTDIVRESIQKAQANPGAISNILSYLETTCRGLVSNRDANQNKHAKERQTAADRGEYIKKTRQPGSGAAIFGNLKTKPS